MPSIISFSTDFLLNNRIHRRLFFKHTKYPLLKAGEIMEDIINLSVFEVIIRLLAATALGSLIGYERELKGHDAGLRTHMLVCIGAAILSMVQMRATYETIEIVRMNPDYAQTISTDITRLTAQIVSGIGFLGAGTIIITKRNVSGLTTAASIWATAGLGIAIGMGYFVISFSGTLIILLVLRLIRRIFKVPDDKLVKIQYLNHSQTKQLIEDYFKQQKIDVFDVEYSVDKDIDRNQIIYTNYYTLNLSSDDPPISKVVDDLSKLSSVIHISSQWTIEDQ